ncbi:MAG: hypothetical protein CM1200mP3_06030 [Chloroflexota bacterium]|nr:MAG: hypothetical protein CM1200mP3_06030 [Chloroflexota bacterium]
MSINALNIRCAKPVVIIATFLLILLVSSGCYNTKTGEVKVGGAITFDLPVFPKTGSHAVQIFSEMHYSPAYRSQEVPRILPPEGSVPITGAEVKVFEIDELKTLDGQIHSGSYDPVESARVYAVNCQVCHGQTLLGDGPITTLNSARGDGTKVYDGAIPVNLVSERVTSLSDGEIFGYITWGGRPGLAAAARGKESTAIMPQFGYLLTEEQRWHLVQYIREQSR